MPEIRINYDEVYKKTSELRNRIGSDLTARVENEYRSLRETIRKVDGAANAKLKETSEENRRKSMMVAQTLDKMLSYMANSAKQVQLNEMMMARSIASGAKIGGES